jgi:hypothetical protein
LITASTYGIQSKEFDLLPSSDNRILPFDHHEQLLHSKQGVQFLPSGGN